MLDVTSTGRRILVPAFSDLRRRWLLVLTAGLVGAAATAAFSLTAQKEYRATATMVVAPVPAGDPTFVGLDVLTDAGGRRSAVATAARLVAAPEIAETVRVRLGLSRSRNALLSELDARPVGSSSAVAVTVTDSDPRRAAQLANAFVDATIAARSAGFQSELVSAIHRLQLRVAQLSPGQRAGAQGQRLQKRLADLQALVGTTDPTLRHASGAVAPPSASWPDPGRLTLYGGLVGLGAGALLAAAAALTAAGRRERFGRLWRRPSGNLQAAERERRLVARESALAQREREVQAALAELREASSGVDDSAAEARAAELGRREALLEERRRELDAGAREA